ncbi:MAG: metallophosphoesterase [Eubacterium sp.]|nr:metallophosphoesterase [Eubacterium sp.]
MKKRVIGAILAAAMFVSVLPVSGPSAAAKKKHKNDGTANLRIFSTTDLHGQSTTFNYDTASLHKNGSLAQISSVIKDSKKTLKNGNTLLVDSGDTIFGIGAKATKEKRVPISSDEQYMYKLMKAMGYDAITLGNHDFDYGYSYEKKILKSSGLSSKTVLCNVKDAKTKKYPWATRKIIKKTVKTTKGVKRTIKIGLTGVVEPGLSTYTPWKDVLEVEDAVTAAEKQVDLLKEEGADIVIILAHTGIGPGEYQEALSEDVTYELADIDGVNVICAGHTHYNYPVKTEEYTKSVLKYDGVSSNGKINGKIVVQEEDHGQAVGITDLKFSFKNGKPRLIKKNTKVRKIKESDPEDQVIIKKNSKYDAAFKELCEKSEAASEHSYNNYFGMLEDNALVQMTNDAKIAHAQKVIKDSAPEYAKYPIIASTTYYQAGGASPNNYITAGGEIKLKDLLNVQMYAQEWAKFYYVTGAQLKEALEWQASAYQAPEESNSSKWKDKNINELTAAGMSPVLSPEWEKWEGLSIFDGVEYVIDVTGKPRYNKAGKLINSDAHRISSLTRDGKNVKDDDIFVWVTRNMTTTHWPMIGEEVSKQLLVKKTKQLANIIEDYVKEQESFGMLSIKADDNWRVDFPGGGNYLVKTSSAAREFVNSKSWFVDTLRSDNGYDYYQINLGTEYKDTAGPMLVVSPLETNKSGDPIDVSVRASDVSGIASVVYAKGNLTEYDSWSSASTVYNGQFKVTDNGEYSVMAKDKNGNKTIKHIRIGNIDPNAANTPKVNKVKNSQTVVTGTATPGATLYVETSVGEFSTTVADDGTFSCDVEGLLAGKDIYVWQVDKKERISDKVAVTVTRGGANVPIVDEITNKNTAITGSVNDSGYCKVVAIRSKKVYIPKGQKARYKKSKIYKNNKKKKIVECDYSYDSETKEFKLKVPKIYADQKFTVLSYDWIGRSSISEKYEVEDVAPNRPEVETVVAQEGKVYGHIPSPKADSYKVKVDVSGITYTGEAGADGKFLIDTKAVPTGVKIQVKATDVDDGGKKRTSIKASAKAVNSFESLKRKSVSKAELYKMNNKDTVVSGYIDASEKDIVSLIMGNRHYAVEYDEYGEFFYKLEEPKKVGAKIGLLIRKPDGTIKSYNYIKVTLAKPDAPVFVTEEVTTETKKVKIKTTEKGKGFLRVGKKRYKSKKIKKKVKGDVTWYYHTFKIKEPKKGKKVIAYLKNKTGYGKKTLLGKVKKAKKDKKSKNKKK